MVEGGVEEREVLRSKSKQERGESYFSEILDYKENLLFKKRNNF